MDATPQIWIVIKQSTNLELKNQFLAWENVKNSHTHKTDTDSKCSQNGVNSQVADQNDNALGPPKVSLLQA